MKSSFILFMAAWLLPLPLIAANQAHAMHHPQTLSEQIKKEKTPGETVYKTLCKNCHDESPLIPVDAPIIRDKQAWAPRMKKGNDAMFALVNQGFGAMPARGGCFECSDQALKDAIQYLLPTL